MNTFLEQLNSGRVLISDGATGTYLQSHGLDPGGCPELMNADAPAVVRQMATDYFAAGADMVETNSFGASRYMLAKYGQGERVEELNRLSAQNARSAAPDGKFVIGSIGPTGEFLEPNGTATEQEMFDVFCEQARGLADGGVDCFCIETMSDMMEMSLAIRACKKTAGLPVLASLTFDQGPRGFFTMFGITPVGAVEQMSKAGADVVGSNCGITIAQMIDIIAAMRQATDKPIIAHVNAGIPKIVNGRIVYPDTPDYMANLYPKLVEAGASIVGGCCGTTPEHIRAIANVLNNGN
jgi:5-methyltetrahydrofolate--homocysteine methyltransferase